MQTSWCTEIQSAPASTKAGMYWSGFSIIRWQSIGRFVAFLKLATTGGPIVIFGTKCPSITSTCSTVAPPSATAWIWSARWAKSADNMEGASSINRIVSLGRRITQILARSPAQPYALNLVQKALILWGAPLLYSHRMREYPFFAPKPTCLIRSLYHERCRVQGARECTHTALWLGPPN